MSAILRAIGLVTWFITTLVACMYRIQFNWGGFVVGMLMSLSLITIGLSGILEFSRIRRDGRMRELNFFNQMMAQHLANKALKKAA